MKIEVKKIENTRLTVECSGGAVVTSCDS